MIRSGRQLAELGHTVLAAGLSGGAFLGAAAENGLGCIPIPRCGPMPLRAAWRLRRAVKLHSIDVVCVKTVRNLRAAALACMGMKTSLTCRRGKTGDIRDTIRHRINIGLLANGVIVPSGFLKREFCAVKWVDPDRIFVMRHTINPAEYQDIIPAQHLPAATCRAIFVGAISRTKGIDTLLEAWRMVNRREPNARLALVGGGGAEYKAMAVEMGIAGAIDFVGFQKDVRTWLAAADILALPSRNEGAGRVLLEAMATGLPIVASRVGGIPEYVGENSTSFLVPPGAPAPLAEALLKLISDPVLRKNMGAAGREKAEREFNDQNAGKELERIFMGLSRRNKVGRRE